MTLVEAINHTLHQEMGRDERVQYRNWASPQGMAQLLQTLHKGAGLSANS